MRYLDNSATTKPCPETVAAVTEMMTEDWGNPSSVHGLGIQAEHRLREARQQVARLLGCEPDRIFFTSGGTEADNWAVFSTAERLGKRGRHIITTQVEHHAILHPMQKLESQGFEVTYLQPDETGYVSVEKLEAALRPDTILVSVMMVNNETGAVMPIADMVRATRRRSPLALFHTDAVQGFGKIDFKASRLGADLISMSAHKIHGIKGAGALYMKKGVNLPPLLRGGGQEGDFRSGTEALPAIVGFGAACAAINLPEENRVLTELRDLCREKLQEIPGVVLLGKGDAPHIVSLSLPGVRSQGLINCLQDHQVYVSAGSACAKGHRSHVMEAMGVDPRIIDGAIRVSFGRENTPEDVEELCAALREAKENLKG